MQRNLLPTLVALSCGWIPSLHGQPQSVLALEQPDHGKAPFRQGEQWDIQRDASVSSGVTRITVLDATHWPWVLVRLEQGEVWLNFDHVASARAVTVAK